MRRLRALDMIATRLVYQSQRSVEALRFKCHAWLHYSLSTLKSNPAEASIRQSDTIGNMEEFFHRAQKFQFIIQGWTFWPGRMTLSNTASGRDKKNDNRISNLNHHFIAFGWCLCWVSQPQHIVTNWHGQADSNNVWLFLEREQSGDLKYFLMITKSVKKWSMIGGLNFS